MVSTTTKKRCIDTISPYLLISSIKHKKWDAVRFYVHLANLVDEDRCYALHHVCRDNRTPLHIVQMIYYAFPDAVSFQDIKERTPLFLAVESSYGKAVHFLAHKKPETVLIRNDEIGVTPLQYALEDFESNEIVQTLLRANPSAARQLNDEREIVFESFFAKCNCSLRVYLEHSTDLCFAKSVLDSKMGAEQFNARDAYFKCSILLKAITIQNVSRQSCTDDLCTLLHSSFKEDACPWSICSFFLRLYPEQIMQTDSNGDLPIHIIAAASNKSSDENTITCEDCGPVQELCYVQRKENYSLRLCPKCCRDTVKSHSDKVTIMKPGMFQIQIFKTFPHISHFNHNYKLYIVQKVPCLIQDLLELNKKMVCIPDSDGNYPLHISILNQQTFGAIKRIFDASPCIGREPSTMNRLIPFKLAAVGDWDDDIEQICTIFYLLKEDPVLVNY